MAQKTVMPLGVFYSPLLVQVDELKKGNFPTCSKCKASVCKAEGNKNNQGQQWNCVFCGAINMGAPGFGRTFVEESFIGKSGDCGIFFIIDQCVSQ